MGRRNQDRKNQGGVSKMFARLLMATLVSTLTFTAHAQ